MQSILNLTKTNRLILATFAFLAVLAFGTGRAHAATLNVAGGCTLPIAINSVNAGSNQSGCTATVSPDGYGTDDTIMIPAGTITLAADLPQITEPVKVIGAGMGQTIVSGDSDYTAFIAIDIPSIAFSDLTMTATRNASIKTQNVSVNLLRVEVDGHGFVGRADGIDISVRDGNSYTVTSDNVYVHHLEAVGSQDFVCGILVSADRASTLDVTMTNSTISNLVNNYGGIFAFSVSAGLGSSSSHGILNATINNTTIDSLSSNQIVAGFGTFFGTDGGATNIDTVINNITLTGIRGEDGQDVFAGLKSAAFYVMGFNSGNGGTAHATSTVSNSLMADNLSGGEPSNCSIGDLTDGFGGSGAVNASIVSAGHNLSDDDSCAGFNQQGDLQNVGNIISTLGPLQNNGGTVPTRALLAGSPAISSGSAVLGVTTDARGVTRPGTCPSVGAFQFEGAVCAASTTNAGSNAGAPNTGVGSASLLQFVLGLLGFGIVVSILRKKISL